VRRRTALLWGATAILPQAAILPRAAWATAPFDMAAVAPGSFVRQGVHEEATPANQDGIANIGFIIGDDAVAVIDPGGSRADGERLRAAIRGRTNLPVRYVIMTHLHPDHVFGSAAFAADRPVFVGHARMAAMLEQRGEFYRAALADALGPGAAGDYAAPGMLVQDGATLDLGRRILRLQAHRTAHTDNDLTVLDEATGTLWMGDLLFMDRVPALDGSIVGWLAETGALRGTSAPWPAAAAAQERYLGGIVRDVRAIIAQGGDIEHAVATVGWSERNNWLLFDDYHGRNVTSAFKELEWE